MKSKRSSASPERTLRKLSATDLDDALRKSQSIIFRVSKSDKTEMQKLAKGFRLTLSEYLVRIHQLIARRVRIR